MKTLYIIGNGFDRFHGLPTAYFDFDKYLTNHKTELKNCLDEYFSFHVNNDSLWSDFEKDLETFNYKIFFDQNCNIDVQDENFRPSFFYSLEDELNEESERLIAEIRETFENWIEEINLDFIEKKLNFKTDSVFLNFNYTLTLEKVYQIPTDKIFHIHGDIEKNQDDLIIGHNKIIDTEPELDDNGDSNRTPFSDSENISKYPFHNFYKPVYDIIKENQLYFDNLKNVKEIFVFGHGLSIIDIPYFEEILKHTKDVFWNISYYKDDEKENHLVTLQKIGINKDAIKTFKL